MKITKKEMRKALKDMPFVVMKRAELSHGRDRLGFEVGSLVVFPPNTKMCDLKAAKQFVLDMFKRKLKKEE